jgi:protein-tyrosine phosphatase
MGEQYSVLFVCHKNECRSPMAACLWMDLVSQHGTLSEWRIESAGTWSTDGAVMALRAYQALREIGLAPDGHHSQSVTYDLMHDYRLVLTMERGQQEALRTEFPEIRNRVFCLSEMVGQHWDLRDPTGSDLTEYVEVAKQIQSVLMRGMTKIMRLARGVAPRSQLISKK